MTQIQQDQNPLWHRNLRQTEEFSSSWVWGPRLPPWKNTEFNEDKGQFRNFFFLFYLKWGWLLLKRDLTLHNLNLSACVVVILQTQNWWSSGPVQRHVYRTWTWNLALILLFWLLSSSFWFYLIGFNLQQLKIIFTSHHFIHPSFLCPSKNFIFLL